DRSRHMAESSLKRKLKEKIEAHRPRTQKLLKEHGEAVIDKVTISQTIGGARDIRALVTDISYLDPQEGIRFRGKTIPETFAALPRMPGAEQPWVEGFFHFLLTGEIPTATEVKEVADDWRRRAEVPKYVFEVLRAMPRDSHPMAMFSSAILVMQRESEFARRYGEGKLKKTDMWDPTYEDAMNLLARLPRVAAFIYRLKYRDDQQIAPDPSLDWGANFAHMMGVAKPYDDVMRMYFILHSDHESGNVSAHATHLVASALSDVYYSLSAGINGLAGPLHGLANQEVLSWIHEVMQKLENRLPTKEQLTKFLWDTLNAGQVIPGYGHAVLRKTDPRFTAQLEFAKKHLPDDPLVRLVGLIYEVAPGVLTEHGKTKNPWPNVDAHSGVIQWHYGVREYEFYTVLFGVGRALGVLANVIWDRGLGYPLERPKSVTTDMLEKWAAEGGRKI
ncbi:MAG TPA: citrate (Si)-synthase, partial [Anaeromyxobacteraceae bacterium]|nr:citrate (Si)-synthase [Anaeromyxobacteraceae bacterium]